MQFRALTGVRFCAALYVVCYHYLPTIGGYVTESPAWVQKFFEAGPAAVGFFFILSGFVLAYRYRSDQLNAPEAESPGRFLLARARKLYPTYLVAFVLFFPMAVAKYLIRSPESWLASFWHLFLSGAASLLLVQSWTPLSQAWNGPKLVAVGKSFLFYTLFPFSCSPTPSRSQPKPTGATGRLPLGSAPWRSAGIYRGHRLTRLLGRLYPVQPAPLVTSLSARPHQYAVLALHSAPARSRGRDADPGSHRLLCYTDPALPNATERGSRGRNVSSMAHPTHPSSGAPEWPDRWMVKQPLIGASWTIQLRDVHLASADLASSSFRVLRRSRTAKL